ncbi:leucine-rich repeat flightless-interacting protein 1 isoform X3 [Microtus oregoni]|uniref:leucine-rich repeat flightless-interacting protein 1 isoform X3 n=1 Tax=Microtus oregoni TaxID=111838 RepID=UPI001BB150FD|nr:leucine-rich repeat flightless-interacting protein 1 isoform X3 [Microtus oregoni]
MDMGTQGSGRKRLPNRERLTAEDDALNQIAREAEARLAAKRAARAEAREIRMKELERQQKEIYQVQKKYYGLDTKWGDIEQWMEDSERYSRRFRRNTSASDEDERLSVGSRGSLRTNGYDGDYCGSQSLSRRSGRNSSYSGGGDGRVSALSSSREEKLGFFCSDLGLPSSGLASKPLSAQNGTRPSFLCRAARPAGSYWASVMDESSLYGARRGSACGSRAPSEYSGHLNSSSRASSRASSARASPVVEERPDKDFTEKGSRNMPSLSAATLASLGGTSSRRGSGDTSISMDTEASIREIKELNELKDQIQDVEGKYMQGLKEMKDSLAEVEEKYKKAMVSNAQLDNEKTNFMYQVDTLKDTLLELEEQLAESQRLYEEKNKEFEREKHAHSILQFQFAEVKEALRQREEMLEEIRQLQQKQAGFIREISDLQETIEWKDKKIGALERQKEFFDSIRSERDELREETVKLKEELKKHGIILNSEITTNGETSDSLNDVGYQGPMKMPKEELNALKSAGEGTLGKAKEVEVKKEIVENVGKGGALQNTEQEQPRPNPEKDCVDKGVSHPREKAEDQRPAEDSALSPRPLPGASCEQQVQSQAQENTSLLISPEQIESHEVTDKPDGRTRNCLEQSNCLGGLDSEESGPIALGTRAQSENSIGDQDEENQEDLKTDLQKVSFEPCPHKADKVSCTNSRDTGDNHMENAVEAGGAAVGEQANAAASGPLEHSQDTADHDRSYMNDGADSERELTQEVAEPEEALIQSPEASGENPVTRAGDTEVRDEKPFQAEVQATPGTPTVQSGHQDATDPGSTDAKLAPLNAKEPNKAKSEQQVEALDSPQKKSKNKKKKNKKKKSPAQAEPRKDASQELNCQDTEAGDLEEEQTQFPDKTQAAETQSEKTESPEQKITAGSSELFDCPEDPKTEFNRKQNQEEEDGVKTQAGKAAAAAGDMLTSEVDVVNEADAAQLSGTSAEGEEIGEHVTDGPTDVLDQNGPRCEEGDISLMERKESLKDANDASQRASEEGQELSQHPGQTVEKAEDGCSVDNSDLSGELGGFNSESGVQARGEVEKSKNKEDCTMS